MSTADDGADTVTNQAVNAFLELGMPYVMQFIGDWREGKTTIKEAVSRSHGEETPPKTQEEVEKRFMKKVERELQLPEYSLFSELSYTDRHRGE